MLAHCSRNTSGDLKTGHISYGISFHVMPSADSFFSFCVVVSRGLASTSSKWVSVPQNNMMVIYDKNLETRAQFQVCVWRGWHLDLHSQSQTSSPLKQQQGQATEAI